MQSWRWCGDTSGPWRRWRLAIPGVAAGLDTEAAAGWRRNPAELTERGRLFDDWCRRLCVFLGVPPGPGLQGSSASVALVV